MSRGLFAFVFGCMKKTEEIYQTLVSQARDLTGILGMDHSSGCFVRKFGEDQDYLPVEKMSIFSVWEIGTKKNGSTYIAENV